MTHNTASSNDAEKKAQVQEYFSRTAASYVSSPSHRTGSDLKRLIELGEWSADQHAIDIATGGGHTALAVAPHVAHVTVTDLTPTMLEQAKAFHHAQGITNVHFQVADAENLPFADASFDRATCRIAPHHFPNIGRAVQEIARVLKPGGLFLLIDNMAPSDPELDAFDNTVEKMRDASHCRSYTQEEWQTFFHQAGLHIEHQENFRRALVFDDWTARSQMSEAEKANLEAYVLNSAPHVQRHFSVETREDGHLQSITIDYIILKGRKSLVHSK
jgi:ubiquinone/menaquinone biosynthesis C-methylase UbiE